MNLLRGLLRLQSGLGLLYQPCKAGCVLHSDIGQDLAIQLDASLFQSIDQLRIAEVVELGCSRDADDPQRAELALLLTAAGGGELEAALYCFLGCLVELGLGEEVAACALENLFA